MAGVAEENIGAILQRGGGELPLTKARDRFTVKLRAPQTAVPEAIGAIATRPIPQTELFIVRVASERLEEAMAIARRLDSIAFASHVYRMANSADTYVYLTDELTLQFTPDLAADAIAALVAPWQLQRQQAIEGIPNAFVYRLTTQTAENPLKIANRLSGQPEILTAEANIIVRRDRFYRPKDSLYPKQWYLYNQGGSQLAANSHIEVEKAWDITRGERTVVVAIADDSIDLNHPDFQGKGKIVSPRDLRDNDFLPLPESDDDNHGTACAGVAVAEENGKGIVGVAPGCALMPIRTTGYLDDSSIEDLCDWAIAKGASVLSCSWGAATINFPLSLRQRAALHRVTTQGRNGKGCVVLFAAGNSNRPVNGKIFEREWPQNVLQGPTQWLCGFAAHPDVIAVAASTSLSHKAAYSNWGAEIALCAPSNNAPPGIWFEQTGYIYTAPAIAANLPGQGIFTSDRVGNAGYDVSDFTGDFGGTSSATPVVAGVAALVLSANPELNAVQVKQILQQSADKIIDPNSDPQLGMRLGTYDQNGRSQWFGAGRVNAFKAVKLAREQLQTLPSASSPISAVSRPSLAIPDGNEAGILSRIAVSGAGTVGDIQVSVAIDHEFLGDLEIYLRPPSGGAILLQGRTLGANTLLRRTYTALSTPALQQALGQARAGNWDLWIVDCAIGDTGILQSWELQLG
ncbi:S8 family serine peptidase [Oscillatoria sp. FACHB-1406]|nr:S8 family serine peptidase [Oscillatoria sp. FACHB-1406]MBD2576316.1 S8 family serine peptidase [Oscillatoria sp. FACHB-1406]